VILPSPAVRSISALYCAFRISRCSISACKPQRTDLLATLEGLWLSRRRFCRSNAPHSVAFMGHHRPHPFCLLFNLTLLARQTSTRTTPPPASCRCAASAGSSLLDRTPQQSRAWRGAPHRHYTTTGILAAAWLAWLNIFIHLFIRTHFRMVINTWRTTSSVFMAARHQPQRVAA